jgi:NADH-quinone oxidoreductase subunit N
MSLNKSINIETISQLKGQIIQNPILSIILTISIFSLAGIPPFIGFFAKLYILLNAINNSYYFLAFIAIFSSVISASVYLRFIKIIHFDEYININSALPYSIKLNESISSIISILTLFIITFIFYPQPILFFINQLYL